MKQALAIGAFLTMSCALATSGPALAQTETQRLNHDVQRLWDNTFDSHRDGDRRDWERRREAERHEWCREHREFGRCRPYYR